MLEQSERKPLINIWFGNFFEPAFSSKKFVRDGISLIHSLGFNSILLDSKSWEDFFARYRGEAASDYIRMQEYMMDCIRSENISYTFLAVYLNGDNLYPKIRYSPPHLGEGVTGRDGLPKRWYRYWSEKAQQSMIDHLHGLYRLYGKNATRAEIGGRIRLPVCTMWDPIAEPSYDEDGICRYRKWLAARYRNIDVLNQKYHLNANSFDELQPEDCWFIEGEMPLPDKGDYDAQTPLYYRYSDFLRWKSDELILFFRNMQKKIHGENPDFYTMPVLSQWDIFLNVNKKDHALWDTSLRGIDPYRIAPYVDNCTFLTVPCMPDGGSCACVSSCENSMIRSMNFGREFTVGFYLGRYLYQDIYADLTPCEIIGTAVGSGASGYQVYGYCGLDDGGMMHKLGRAFQDSLQCGNEWAKRVIPRLKGARIRQAAILYPEQMALTEPYFIEGNEERRKDLLGYYQAVCDCGLQADILHPVQVAEGILSGYRLLIVPEDSCWKHQRNRKAEQEIIRFVQQGGTLIYSGSHPIGEELFGITSRLHPKECIRNTEGIILCSNHMYAFDGGKTIARYEDSGQTAIAQYLSGNGIVYAFGFAYGSEYIKKETEAVPVQYGNRDYYPLCLTEYDPFRELLENQFRSPFPAQKGIEYCTFEDGIVVINHTSYPWDSCVLSGEKDFQIPCAAQILMPHSAVWIGK